MSYFDIPSARTVFHSRRIVEIVIERTYCLR